MRKTDRRERNRRQPVVLEALEGRNLLSAGGHMRVHAAEVQAAHHMVGLHGTFQGQATVEGFTPQGGVQVGIAGSGELSHFGHSTIVTSHVLTLTSATTTALTDGVGTITAANGDQLFLTYQGTGVRTAVGFDDTFDFTITGGTGRFEGATGSGTVQSTDLPGLAFVANLDGILSSVGSNKA